MVQEIKIILALKNKTLALNRHASYFYAIFGNTLVLFVLGVAAIFVLEAKRISTHFKENLTVELVLRDSLEAAKISSLEGLIRQKPYVKNLKYVSKDDAAKILRKDLGENFLDILGYNPLYASYIINLHENYANKDSFETINTELSGMSGVKKVSIQNNLLESLDKNVQRASLIILFVAGILLVFAISLIFNTIRLALYASRFTIKTMQLFGATRSFIIRPFLNRSIWNGFLSGFIASLLVSALILYFDYTLPELGLEADFVNFAVLLAAVILFGILISYISTLIAIFRYLRLKVENLY